jgi:hypothetical protein
MLSFWDMVWVLDTLCLAVGCSFGVRRASALKVYLNYMVTRYHQASIGLRYENVLYLSEFEIEPDQWVNRSATRVRLYGSNVVDLPALGFHDCDVIPPGPTMRFGAS